MRIRLVDKTFCFWAEDQLKKYFLQSAMVFAVNQPDIIFTYKIDHGHPSYPNEIIPNHPYSINLQKSFTPLENIFKQNFLIPKKTIKIPPDRNEDVIMHLLKNFLQVADQYITELDKNYRELLARKCARIFLLMHLNTTIHNDTRRKVGQEIINWRSQITFSSAPRYLQKMAEEFITTALRINPIQFSRVVLYNSVINPNYPSTIRSNSLPGIASMIQTLRDAAARKQLSPNWELVLKSLSYLDDKLRMFPLDPSNPLLPPWRNIISFSDMHSIFATRNSREIETFNLAQRFC